jgi:hypothetical protein
VKSRTGDNKEFAKEEMGLPKKKKDDSDEEEKDQEAVTEKVWLLNSSFWSLNLLRLYGTGYRNR